MGSFTVQRYHGAAAAAFQHNARTHSGPPSTGATIAQWTEVWPTRPGRDPYIIHRRLRIGKMWARRGRARSLLVSSVSDLSSRVGPSQPGELGGGAKARHRRLASRTLTASQGNAAKPGGRARRPCLRRTDAPRGTLQGRACADTGCRVSQRLVWTRAQLHYLTKRQQRNVTTTKRLIKRRR